MHAEAVVLLIRSNLGYLRKFSKFCKHLCGPEIKLTCVCIFERVLILSTAYAVVNGEVLHGLQVEMNSWDEIDMLL